MSTALHIIRAERNLDIFSVPRSATPSRMKGLPSWVPDWTVEESTSPLLKRKYFFATLPPSEAVPKLQPDGPAVGLGLRGQLIDCVQEVGVLFVKPINMSASAATIQWPAASFLTLRISENLKFKI